MKILLDTQILIWYVQGNTKLQISYRELIINPKSEIFISVASLWEMAIKMRINKLDLNCPLEDFIPQGILLLPIRPKHIYQTLQLPLHHRDPFDRIIIAQSITDEIAIMTEDNVFSLYTVNLV
jgi:PIN domain nuclease of toxin-antitoxin system